jgi:hypothetical protein
MPYRTALCAGQDTSSLALRPNKFVKLVLIYASHAFHRQLAIHAQLDISRKVDNVLAVEFHVCNVLVLINAFFVKVPITTIMGLVNLAHLYALLVQALSSVHPAIQTLMLLPSGRVPYAAA